MLIAELNTKLEAARRAYYAGSPVMSDAEYDLLESQLKGLVKANPDQRDNASVLTTVGSDLPLFAGLDLPLASEPKSIQRGRIAHRVPMLSIENFYTIDDLCAWAESLGWPVLSVGSKLDGVSDELVYESGTLCQALTRGDGAAGESVLPQMKASGAIPSSIPTFAPYDGRVEIRGEVVIPESSLQALNAELDAAGAKTYATSRNLAAGTLKLLDLKEAARRGLRFYPWDVLLPDGVLPDSGVERLKEIVPFGFAPSDDRIVTNRDELVAAIEELLLTLQEPGTDIGKDGIVVKVDSHTLREKLGRGEKFTHYQVCFKPQNQKAETVITDVVWQVGRQGRVTPVAVFEPRVLGGARISRATLHNYDMISAMDIRVGSKVSIVRSGDVIPKVTEVLENGSETVPVSHPLTCPSCGAQLFMKDEEDPLAGSTAYWCTNDACPGRVCDYLTYIANRTVLEIDALGPELAAKLKQGSYVPRISDALSRLYEFQVRAKAQLSEGGTDSATVALEQMGFPGALTLRMLSSLDKVKTAPWSVWIAAMAIPMVGRRLGKVLASYLRLQPDDFPGLPDKLAGIKPKDIDGLGVSIVAELQRYASNPDWRKVCENLHALGVRPASIVPATENATSPLKGVRFVITGEFEAFGSRDDVTAKLEALGAVAKSGVSKNATHLIVGTKPGKSKLDKAIALGITQVGLPWLTEVLSNNEAE
jgi:DNA ligase (NAD+)